MTRAAWVALAALVLAPAAHAGPWSRSYVVDWLEPAFFHDGPENDNIAPGSDCPAGTAVRPSWEKALKTPWRDEKEIAYYMDAEQAADLKRVIRWRGPNYEDVWSNPTLAPDLGGLPPVSGNTGWGFNLDGKVKPTDFTSPDGDKGVDNNYYRAAGCWVSYLGAPYHSQRGVGINGYMRDGLYTIVVVMSGAKDPMNDDDVTLGFYQSKDRLPKDANGQVARDATFAIKPVTKTQSIVKAKITKGVIETRFPQEIRMRDEAWNSSIPDQLLMSDGQLRFRIKEDGGFEGYFGGYRDWKLMYKRQAVPARDTETLQGIDMPSFYYALERHADGDPDPVTGKNRKISTAYRIRAVPAFVLTPDYKQVVEIPRVFDDAPPVKLAQGGAGAGE
ncbi:MAG TPA: hypothetical protein VGO52_20440 [Hyphomonadaceae bacterium]|jgi:hypothetical protein|nr:hypothetical protein [Hyphomonadaceae bacterium]